MNFQGFGANSADELNQPNNSSSQGSASHSGTSFIDNIRAKGYVCPVTNQIIVLPMTIHPRTLLPVEPEPEVTGLGSTPPEATSFEMSALCAWLREHKKIH